MQRVGFKTELLQVALVSHGILDGWEGAEVAEIARAIDRLWHNEESFGHAVGVRHEGSNNWTCLLQYLCRPLGNTVAECAGFQEWTVSLSLGDATCVSLSVLEPMRRHSTMVLIYTLGLVTICS